MSERAQRDLSEHAQSVARLQATCDDLSQQLGQMVARVGKVAESGVATRRENQSLRERVSQEEVQNSR